MSKKRIIILGGGFAGINTAMQLERRTRRRSDIEITLISHENYLVFQPMLPEVISGNIGILDFRQLVIQTCGARFPDFDIYESSNSQFPRILIPIMIIDNNVYYYIYT